MFFKKTDVLIIAAVAAAAAVLYFFNSRIAAAERVKAEIYYYSQLVETIDLSKKPEKTFSIGQNKNVVFHTSEGYIWFEQSDCPDKICIRSGKLGRPGQSAACLPNGIIVKTVPLKKGGDYTDAVTGQ